MVPENMYSIERMRRNNLGRLYRQLGITSFVSAYSMHDDR